MRALVFFATAAVAAAAQIGEVQSVYLLPMSNGLDQYLAHRLTAAGVFRVVTDPRKADAVFTDRLGEGFEASLDRLLPPETPEHADKDKNKDGDKDGEQEKKSGFDVPAPVRPPAFSRAKGTIFLVHVKSRDVLWSAFEQPKDNSAKNLDRTAERIAGNLRQKLSGK